MPFVYLIIQKVFIMKTLRLNLSKNAIETHQSNAGVNQLRDNRQSVYYRYMKKDRNLGTFFGVFHKQGKTKWIKLGCYPALSAKDSLLKMSQLTKEAALKSTIPNEVEFKTVGELLAWYSKRQANNKALAEHTKKNQLVCIKQHLLPLLGDIKISSISLPLIDEVLFQPLQAKLALSTVDNILSVLNAAIKRAIQVQLIK
jgi:hypothetical protein